MQAKPSHQTPGRTRVLAGLVGAAALFLVLSPEEVRGRASSPPSQPPSQAAKAEKSNYWSGTIRYTNSSTIRITKANSSSFDSFKSVLVITVTHGKAKVEASYAEDRDSRARTCDTHTTVVERGQFAGVDAVRVEKQGGRYEAFAPSASIQTTKTTTFERSPDPNCSGTVGTTTRKSVAHIHALQMAGDVKRGDLMLRGTKTVREPPRSDCGTTGVECTSQETVVWNLRRTAKLKVTHLKLYDRDIYYGTGTCLPTPCKQYTPLAYLSASRHRYLPSGSSGRGYTPIYGTVALEGLRDDELEKIALEIKGAGRQVLAKPVGGQVTNVGGVLFNSDKTPKEDDIEVQFELSPAEAARIDQKGDGKLTLQVIAQSNWDELRDEKHTIKVEKLVLFTGDGIGRTGVCALPPRGKCRYGPADEPEGGDSWTRPSTLKNIETLSNSRHLVGEVFGLAWGDFSNMHGARFYQHGSHRTGLDVDGKFRGYFKLVNGQNTVTAQAADLLRLFLLSDFDISKIFVTYSSNPCDEFCKAMKAQKPLPNDRMLSSYVRFEKKHDDHFHIRFQES